MPVPSTITFDSLLKTGVIPRSERSGIERAFDRLRESKDKGEFHAIEAMKGVRQVAESGIVGGVLGALHASRKNGLDMPIGTPAAGQAQRMVPVDAALMVLGFAGGVFMATEPHGTGKTAMNASAAAAAVFMFRQTNDFMTKLTIKKSGITPGGGAALPNANAAALQPGVISKARFAAEGSRAWGTGFAAGSAGMHGEDPVVRAARDL